MIVKNILFLFNFLKKKDLEEEIEQFETIKIITMSVMKNMSVGSQIVSGGSAGGSGGIGPNAGGGGGGAGPGGPGGAGGAGGGNIIQSNNKIKFKTVGTTVIVTIGVIATIIGVIWQICK